MGKVLKIAGIFIIVFVLSWMVFSGRLHFVRDLLLPRPETSQELSQELRDRYFGISPFWLERYGASVRAEADILVDADGDGLTLIEEYQYLTHPFEADSDRDGFSDGVEVGRGFSPTGKGRLDVNSNGLPDPWEERHELTGEEDVAGGDVDGDGLSNKNEFLYGTDPRNADTDGDGFDDGREVRGGYDPDAPGEARSAYSIIIDKINVDAPIVLSQDASEKVLQKDLERGVIHYPQMAIPGQAGNSYIAGHSSNYSWSPGNFNTIFKDLNNVVPGDTITVTETLANGREVRHKYIITMQAEVEADDGRIFADAVSSVLTLTTCWPLGTADRRIMVKAELIDTNEEIVYNTISDSKISQDVPTGRSTHSLVRSDT